MVVIVHDINLVSNGTSHIEQTNKEQTTRAVSFVQALHEKYVDQDELENQIILPKDKAISTEITFVGFGTVSNIQKQLRRITSIDLSSRDITIAGNTDELKGILNQVTLLNLAGNRLNWQEIISILTCLPNLREIIITSNDLCVRERTLIYPSQLFNKLTSLTLGKADLNWDDIVSTVSRIWNGIEQIDLWDNKLDEDRLNLHNRDDHIQFTDQIKELRLSQNNFTRIDWIINCGTLGNLLDLDLSRCKLETFIIQGSTLHCLSQLRKLNISYNNIHDWLSISSLNSLPNLTNLICNDNPFFVTEKLAKSLAIARISKLKFLNREEIANPIRRDSEILYLRKTFPEYKAFKEGTNPEFSRLHPRYEEICRIYGIPEDTNVKKVDKYIMVNLCYGDKRVSKKMPRDLRVSNLQMLCKRLFKLKPSSKVEIFCCAGETGLNTTSYPLDKDSQTLHFFSVKDNYNLLIKVNEQYP